MTGAGSATVEHTTGRFAVEVRAVNHRFLKTSIRTPTPLARVEPAIEARIRRAAVRGHVSLNARFTPSAEAVGSSIDEVAFMRAAERLKDLARDNELRDPVMSDVMRLPGVTQDVVAAAADALEVPALEAVDAALAQLVTSRRREGAMLVAEIEDLLARIETLTLEVERRAEELPGTLGDRLQGRLEALLAGSSVALDPEQLAREVALLADKADVREEIARLRAHVTHAREVLAGGGPLGRRLDFLVQEMHREANTIGSKGTDLALSHGVVDLKADVERLREQVQNLE